MQCLPTFLFVFLSFSLISATTDDDLARRVDGPEATDLKPKTTAGKKLRDLTLREREDRLVALRGILRDLQSGKEEAPNQANTK